MEKVLGDERKYIEYPENWVEIREEIKRRDGCKCKKCGEQEYLVVHHVLPLSQGGSNDPSNLITLCDKCHSLIHIHIQTRLGRRFLYRIKNRLRLFLREIGLQKLLRPDIFYLLGYFGLSDFRLGQKEIIQSILSGQDTIAIMPTGGGKSLCFQLPAIAFPEGLTLVVSPLISLMQDQVTKLLETGLPATFIK